MLSLPFQVLGVWLRGLLSLALLSAGVGFLAAWYYRLPPGPQPGRPADVASAPDRQPSGSAVEDRRAPEAAPAVVARPEPWRPGWDRETALLLGGLALVAWSLGGGLAFRGMPHRRKADDPPAETRGVPERVQGPGGADLHVEVSGPADGPTVVLVHGWGLDAGEWCYARDRLARRHRVIAWDLPGLGRG